MLWAWHLKQRGCYHRDIAEDLDVFQETVSRWFPTHPEQRMH